MKISPLCTRLHTLLEHFGSENYKCATTKYFSGEKDNTVENYGGYRVSFGSNTIRLNRILVYFKSLVGSYRLGKVQSDWVILKV